MLLPLFLSSFHFTHSLPFPFLYTSLVFGVSDNWFATGLSLSPGSMCFFFLFNMSLKWWVSLVFDPSRPSSFFISVDCHSYECAGAHAADRSKVAILKWTFSLAPPFNRNSPLICFHAMSRWPGLLSFSFTDSRCPLRMIMMIIIIQVIKMGHQSMLGMSIFRVSQTMAFQGSLASLKSPASKVFPNQTAIRLWGRKKLLSAEGPRLWMALHTSGH